MDPKSELLAKFTPKPVKVDLTTVAATVHILPWSLNERLAFREWAAGAKNNLPAVYRRMIASSVCDEAGKLLFSEGDLQTIGGEVAEELAENINELNGIVGRDAKKGSSANVQN
jgi:hypothetical protein